MAKKRKPAPSEESSSEEEEEEQQEVEESSEEEEEEGEEEEEEGDEEEEEEGSSSPEESSSSSSEEEEDPQDENSKREKIRKLLDPFSKDQLIEILKEAANTNRSVVAGIIQTAVSDPVHRRIFVHGLGWDVTSAELLSAFQQYGPVQDCNVVTDKVMKRSKGYGFVIFETRSGAKKALKQPQKKIGNRMALCQLASAGTPGNSSSSDPSERRIYVANVGPQISVEKLRDMFARYGEIEDGPSGFDRVTGKFKGFAMILYKTVEGFKKALEEPTKMLDGAILQCSKAIVKNNPVGSAAGGSSRAGASANFGPAVAPSNMMLPTYPFGLNQGLVGQNANQGTIMANQNAAMGILNPMLGAGGSVYQSGLLPSFPGAVSQAMNRGVSTPAMGLSAGFGTQAGINSISPNVIGTYGSQAALQGLGAYQSPQLGQSSAPAAAKDSIESAGALPSYYRH